MVWPRVLPSYWFGWKKTVHGRDGISQDCRQHSVPGCVGSTSSVMGQSATYPFDQPSKTRQLPIELAAGIPMVDVRCDPAIRSETKLRHTLDLPQRPARLGSKGHAPAQVARLSPHGRIGDCEGRVLQSYEHVAKDIEKGLAAAQVVEGSTKWRSSPTNCPRLSRVSGVISSNAAA